MYKVITPALSDYVYFVNSTCEMPTKGGLCSWHGFSQLDIVKFDEISKLEIAAVSALYWLSQFCTLKKIRNRLRE
jgi:hypothetical protein